jgi:Spy/CpxP family protein refolding chaperone
MTRLTKRFVLASGAGLIVLGVTAGMQASIQNTNQDPAPFSGARGGQRGPGRPMGPWGPMGLGPDGALGILHRLGARLGLTDAQQDQIKNIAQSHREEWKALGDRARAAHDALEAAIAADTVDDALIRAKSAEVAAVEADMAVASAHARAEAWQVLTKDQQAQAKQIQSDMRTRMKARGGR